MVFDDINKIYFLHLSDRYDREKWIKNQIDLIGFPEDKVNIWWTCRRLFFNNENNAFSKAKHLQGNPNVISNVINCALEHYTIIRTSYERGFNHILIFEDDVKFNINLKAFKECIKQIPDGYCCVKFINVVVKDSKYRSLNTLTFDKIKIPDKNLYRKINCKFLKIRHLCCTAAYLLDREGMKQIINIYHEFGGKIAADWVFNHLDYIYIPKYNLVSLQNYNCSKNDLVSDLLSVDTTNMFSQFEESNNQNYIQI